MASTVDEAFAAVIGSDISIIERPSVAIAGKGLSTGAAGVIRQNECYSMCLVSPSRIHAGGLIERIEDACC